MSPGSLAYTEDEEAMLVRVGSGWQYVLVSEGNEMHNRAKILSFLLFTAWDFDDNSWG